LATYTTPGVYYQRIDATAPAISAIRTDVAGFVGLAVSGPLDTPVPVQSWKQFQAYFGGFSGGAFLAYAVRGFFENGGRRCWVVRVASNDPVGGALPATLELASTTPGRSVWKINASSPGTWGNSLTLSLRETHQAQSTGRLDKDHPERLTVSSTTGFSRFSMVQLSQPGKPSVLRVVAAINTTQGFASLIPDSNQFLIWVPEQPELRLPYDSSPLDFAPDQPIQVESVEYTVIVEKSGIPVALYPGLSLIPESDNYGPTVLSPLLIPPDLQAQQVLPPLPTPIVIEELRPEFTADSIATFRPLEQIQPPADNTLVSGGQEGLRLLTAYDFMGEPVDPLDSDLVKKNKLRGLRVLETVDEVSILAVPDINIQPLALTPIEPLPPCIPDICLPGAPDPLAPPSPPSDTELPPTFSDADMYRVQAAMVEQCEQTGSRVALLEPPVSAVRDERLGISAVQSWRNQFDSKYAAFYFPWLRVVDPLRSTTAVTRDIPPSGHVAGQYARTDIEIGVHKAPANAPLAWVQDVTIPVNNAQHGVLNPLGINAIRPLPGRGIRIFGARTVSSDPDWRFISVRRLMIMIEKAIYLATQWAVFEPNDEITQAKLRLSLTSFLLALWQKGALAGNTADAAFFVRCDQTTNPASQRANGQLVALIGIAPVSPFEFVVVRVGRTENQFEITEQTFGTGVQ
jgi:phage tail sheath protein FI